MSIKNYKIRNKRLTDEEFFRIRNEEVLPMWPETSKALQNFDECVEGAREYAAGKNYAEKLLKAESEGIHLMQPQFGQALTEYMIDGIGFVESDSPLLPDGMWNIYSDSYTRKLNFKMAQVGIERSKKEGATALNGWPIVCFGLEEARKIKKAVQSPISLNSTDEDGRLQSEFALAAGWNGANCRSITEVLSHCKDIPLEEEIRINQYESRLAAKYHEAGVAQCPHISSNLTGYDTSGFKVFVMAAQCLMGGEQGLKQIVLENGLNMNMIQDAAVIHTSQKLCYEFSKKFGYDMHFIKGSFPFLGAWPPRVEEASAMVSWNTMSAMMGGVTQCILKCQDEAFATPTKEGMSASVKIADMIRRLIGDQITPHDSAAFKLECEMIELEARAMLKSCLEAGEGDIAVGICRGFEEGWISTMVSPWKYNKGNVRVMRDADNAVRYLDVGDIQLPKEVVDYHREKLDIRAKKEGRPCDFEMAISDLQFASRIF